MIARLNSVVVSSFTRFYKWGKPDYIYFTELLLSNFEEYIYATFQSIQVPLSEHQLSLESDIMAIICLLLICGFVGKYKRYLN